MQSVVNLKVSHKDLMDEYNIYVEAKQTAIRKIYQEVGKATRDQLRGLAPVDEGDLRRAFKYRTTSTKNNISVIIGIIKDADYAKVANYLRFLLYGTRPHWVSLKAHPEIAKWALKHGLITGTEGAYYDTNPTYNKSGTKQKKRAVKVSSKSMIAYIEQIQKQAVRDILNKLENSSIKE